MLLVLTHNEDRRPVVVADLSKFLAEASSTRWKRFINRRIIRKTERELKSMKTKFYSELTDTYYDTSKECIDAELRFKADQATKKKALEDIKRKALEEEKRVKQLEAEREDAKLWNAFETAFEAMQRSARKTFKAAQEYCEKGEYKDDPVVKSMVSALEAMCRMFDEDDND